VASHANLVEIEDVIGKHVMTGGSSSVRRRVPEPFKDNYNRKRLGADADFR
jgi:hypothetical protein